MTRLVAAAAGIMATMGVLPCAAQKPALPASQATQSAAEPRPAVAVPVAPLGYTPPTAFYLSYRLSSASLGFLDDDHLLFTFRVGGLLRRMPSDRDGDEDQQIRAVVLDLRAGKAIRQAEWRMHDRQQYLWPFPDGKFLVRVRDTLFLTDDSLTLQPYLSFDTPLENVEISPDRKSMLVERDDPGKMAPLATMPGDPEVRHPVRVEIVELGSRTAHVIREAEAPVHVPLMDAGIADVLEGKQEASWVVRDVPLQGDPKIFAEVKSNCRPTVQPVSATVALVIGCYEDADDRPVVAVSTKAGELWQERWLNKYVWGWFTAAENGSRFVYESDEVSRPVSVFDSLDPEDISQQLVGVYDTESGKLVLVKDATPVLTAGQNVALSADGKRFAVLRHGAIEIYDLPPVSSAPARPGGSIPKAVASKDGK
ncbi:MAG TPA: hypothetical protein VIY53_12895 [Acidobacteriaceae bacterium]